MDRSEKERRVSELSARLGGAKCLYLTDFTGLDVSSMTELRRRLTEARVEYAVVKNTLARRALSDSRYAELSDHLVGPNAFAWSEEDVVSPAKILSEFAEEHERPDIKAGAIEGEIVSMEEIRRLATLPPREELLAQLVGYANAPLVGLVRTLNSLLGKFVRTVDAVREKRQAEEGVEEAPEAPEEAPEAAPEQPEAEATAESAEEEEAEEPQPAPEASAEELEAPEPEEEPEAPEETEEEK